MGQFKGTIQEFKRYVSPFLRNLIQQITRKRKKAVGACEHCGAVGELEAAHMHGRDRNDIINLLLGTSDSNAFVDVDLKSFERAFKREHDPIEKTIHILCNNCHNEYDEKTKEPVASSTVPTTELPPLDYSSHDVLPISLNPPRPDDFKAKLLQRRKAVIEVLYKDGSVKQKLWNALFFTNSSNVLGNLRSRPEFRRGVWQQSGIVKVSVRVTG